jgi:hypothetical protein
LQIGDRGELRHRIQRQVGQPKIHGLDASAANIAGLHPPRRTAEATMDAHDGPISLRSVSCAQNLADLGRRRHRASPGPSDVRLHTHQAHSPEGQTILIANQTRFASRGEAIKRSKDHVLFDASRANRRVICS